jgi:HlyD family secretion protein
LTATVTADGRSRVKDLYVLAAPVDGSLERIVAEAGDSVPGGSVVARLVPLTPRPLDARTRAEAIAAVSSARASVARAEATQKEAEGALAHAESELATARKLAGEGAAARNSVVHGEHDVEVRLQAVAAARSAVQASRFDLTRAEALVAPTANRFAGPPTLVRSPVAGRLLRVLREDAGPLIAGTPLVEIGNIATLEFVADLLTTDAMTVRAGAAAMIRDWGGKPELAARVRRVEPGAFTKVSALGLEEQRVRVVLDPTAAPPVGFGNDFHVSVSIVTWNGPDVLAVPSSALFRSGADWAVFVMRDGRARLARVTPGPSDGERTVIESGLSEGESVIVQPSDLLRDGTRVKALRKR